MGLNDDWVRVDDALGSNETAARGLTDETFKKIALALAETWFEPLRRLQSR